MNLLFYQKSKKGSKKKIDIANKIFIKKQNLNLILKDLERKNILKLDLKEIIITNKGIDLIDKTTNRVNEKIIKIFKKTDPKNMSGFINIIESI